MYYRQRPPRRRLRDYLKPFFVLIVLAGIIVFGWRYLNEKFLSGGVDALNERVFLNIENGSVKAMTAENSVWQNVPDRIPLYRGERLKTGADGRATLTYADQSLTRMEAGTEVLFSRLKENNIEIELNRGELWGKIEPTANKEASFTIQTDLLQVNAKPNSIFSVEAPGNINVIQGSVQAGVKYNEEIIKIYTVGVGQQIQINEASREEINKKGEPEVISAVSDEFKKSDWYFWNMKKDGSIEAFEEPEATPGEAAGGQAADGTTVPGKPASDGTTAEPAADAGAVTLEGGTTAIVVSPKNGSSTNESLISLEGKYDSASVKAVYVEGKKANMKTDGTWKISGITLEKEGKNSLKIESENASMQRKSLGSFEITLDTTPIERPNFTEPGINGAKVKIDDIEQIIKGTVSADTQSVIVNDYKLGKYVPGSKTFSYYAKTAYNNLKVGENEYIAYAEDAAGNKSDAAKITLVLEQSVYDEKTAEAKTEETTDSATQPAPPATEEKPAVIPENTSTSTGGVAITEPNGGKNFSTSETEVYIKGTAPAGAAKVVVNDYTLSKFAAGDTAWAYKASKSLGSLKIGQENVYTVKAFNADGDLMGQASITINVESGEAAAPVITIPSSGDTYSTNLNELVVGGTIGKWAQAVYVNGKKLDSYIPGTEKWTSTITLNNGENVVTVYSTRDGVQSTSDKITINYTP